VRSDQSGLPNIDILPNSARESEMLDISLLTFLRKDINLFGRILVKVYFTTNSFLKLFIARWPGAE